MRNGRMLAEDTPSNLLSTFNCTLLEDVTLKLCRADESSNKNVTDIISACNQKVKNFKFKSSWKETIESTVAKHQGIPVGLFKRSTEFDNTNTGDVEITRKMSNISKTSRLNDIYHNLRKVQGITMVQALNVLRQKIFLAFFLLLPTIQGSCMFNTMGWKPREMNIGVVNEEVLNWTSLCSAEHFLKDSCDLTFLSCKYLQEIEIPMNSVKQARIKVYDGDLKEYVASLFMLQDFLESYGAFLERLAESCQMNGIIAKIPIEFKTPVYGSLDDSYTEFMVPGIIFCFSFMLTSSITAILYITDRENGTLLRGQVAGLKTMHILLGYITTQGLLGILQIVLWSMTCYIWLGYSVRGPIWLYFLICLLVCICAIAFGLLLGIVCSDSVQAMVIQIFLGLFIFLYGGFIFAGATWPLEAFPTFARYIGYFVPITLPTLSIRSVVVRGLTLTHPLVWPGVVSIITWILVLVLCLTVIIPN
ncbi:ABC transporter G family member 20 [Orchesella cincta]|uniref:ABC transporter G family member 20 n=1 Tax=Orchesella cincta TaxID=48709 RepID=A0A1D2MCH3_ORCCI|nr:ABC transporter G family member 20 [Orchesella cincta]